MRDILVSLIFTYGAFLTLTKPHVGVLVWAWLSYMNPHRLCYGFAYSLPLTYIIALITLLAYGASKERKTLPKDPLVIVMFVFLIWMGITTIFALEAIDAPEVYLKIIKLQIPVFLTLAIFNHKQRLHQLLWVIILSIGYFGIKGGIFTVLSGGSYHVWGPPESVLEDNNALAVAELMILPLMVYLRKQLQSHWKKQVMLFCIVAMTLSALGSQSRGALVALSLLGGYFWLQSKNKLPVTVALIILAATLYQFLPESWHQRMDTISTYDQDESAQGRIRAWTLAFNIANDRLFGGGFGLWSMRTYKHYLPGFTDDMPAYVAHSIYFHVLGEHGWIGLFLFLLIFGLGWRSCGQTLLLCKNIPEISWIADLTRMVRLSLLAYLTGGTFLSLSYLDLAWHLLAMVVLLKEMAKQAANNLPKASVKIQNQAKAPYVYHH